MICLYDEVITEDEHGWMPLLVAIVRVYDAVCQASEYVAGRLVL
ncbi:hypothetical protein [Phytohalomonas tamaricis]|nr:hypothetical protein [Phytohalomonas tamaricis]